MSTLKELNSYLFAQLDRMDQTLTADELAHEVARSKSITAVADTVLHNAEVQLNALKLKAEYQGLSADEVQEHGLMIEHKRNA